ncbi:MAG: HAD family phosphatase [Lachnospiraceae bacterium]|nr:HAD family phosphatase [Lachnospiraceae bacterium]
MLRNKKAVIFDLDGTLVDSMWMWKSIDIEYLGKFGIDLPPTLQKDIEGMSFSETAVYFKETFELSDSLEQIKADWNDMAYEKYTKEVDFKAGAKEFLKYCKKNHIKLGIATSNSRELVDATMEALGVREYFDCIKTSCEVARGKPAPDIYLAVAQNLNVPVSDCLVFEDVEMGILAGKNAGMEVCAIEDDFSMDQLEKKKQLADYYIKDFYDINFK